MQIEWESLAEGVWLLRGIPADGIVGESPTEFTVVVVDEGQGVAKLLAGERIDTREKSQALTQSLKNYGFSKAHAFRDGKEKWYV